MKKVYHVTINDSQGVVKLFKILAQDMTRAIAGARKQANTDSEPLSVHLNTEIDFEV